MSKKNNPIRARRRTNAEKDKDSWSFGYDGSRSYGSLSVRWWESEDCDSAVGKLWLWVDRLRQHWRMDAVADLIREAAYLDEPIGSGYDGSFGQHLGGAASFSAVAPANLNIIMSLVDTAAAMLTKRRPMSVISADDSGWSEQLFAKRSSRILRRKMGGPDVERIRPQVIRDMIIRGTGCGQVTGHFGDTITERVPIHEYVYDPKEAQYSNYPSSGIRTLAKVSLVPREILMARYPDHKDEISKASPYNRSEPWMMYVYQGPTFADHVEVAQSWHLPSRPESNDGQEIIAIRGCTLMRRYWRRPRFPMSRCFWNAPIRGFRGRGLVHQLMGIQLKINDILRDAQEGMFYGSQLKVFVQRGSNIVKNHLRARHPSVVEFDGSEPHFVAPNPVSNQAIEMLMMLIDQAHKISGINEMKSQGRNPLGSNASGKALDTLEDIQSDRFAHVESNYQQWVLELSRIHIDEARSLYDEAINGIDAEKEWPHPPAVNKSDLAPWIREIDWSKIQIDEGNYHLVMEPINFLPDSRAGRLSFVSELKNLGLIPDPTMTASLFDEPDISSMNRSILGPINNIKRMLEDLADPDVDIQDCLPTSYTNPALFVLMAKGEMEEAASHRNVPMSVLERYDKAIKYAKDLRDMQMSSASLPGMQSSNMVSAPNASTLQSGVSPGPSQIPSMVTGPTPGGA